MDLKELYRGRFGDLEGIFAVIVTSMAAGAVLAWIVLFKATEATEDWVKVVSTHLMLIIAIALIIIVYIYPAVRSLIISHWHNITGTFDQFVSKAASGARALATGNLVAAIDHYESAVREGVAWYGLRATRRWVVQASFGLLIAFGGVVGTTLLFRQTLLMKEQNVKLTEQTNLLKEQNEKLDLQTVSAETAQRRSMLAPELFSLLQTIAKEAGKPLERDTVVRIEAFSQAATPYFSLQVEDISGARVVTLSKQQKSAERGQLLSALTSARTALPTQANFDFADLRSARLSKASLEKVKLSNADLEDADLSFSQLREASLSGTSFRFANLKGADLSDAVLNYNNFALSDLTGATFAGVRAPKALDSFVSNVCFASANLIGADFTGAKFNRFTVDWSEAVVGRKSSGALPDGFPKGWAAPPDDWTLATIEDDFVVLRRLSVPPKGDLRNSVCSEFRRTTPRR
jgi:uncharacterized protein YjbI with pentapeptide repeats